MASPAAFKKVLVPITAGSEPVEAFVPIAVLRRAGADVTVAAAGAGAGAGLRVHAMYGVTVVADASVADCADASYDLVVLPGGVPGAENLGGCAALESVVGGRYAAICAAPPLALASWALLNGVKATAHPAFVDKFPAEVAAVDANVVVDGRVVTGRGPAPAMEFALALVELLYGKDKVDEIAKPMKRTSKDSFGCQFRLFHTGLLDLFNRKKKGSLFQLWTWKRCGERRNDSFSQKKEDREMEEEDTYNLQGYCKGRKRKDREDTMIGRNESLAAV